MQETRVQSLGRKDPLEKGIATNSSYSLPSGSDVKHLPAMQETWVQFLGKEDLLEKGMATHASILAWRIPWTEKPGRLQFMGSQELDTDE